MLCRAIAKHLPRTCFTVVSFWIGRSEMKNLLPIERGRFLANASEWQKATALKNACHSEHSIAEWRISYQNMSFWIEQSEMKNLNLSSSNMRFLAFARNDITVILNGTQWSEESPSNGIRKFLAFARNDNHLGFLTFGLSASVNFIFSFRASAVPEQACSAQHSAWRRFGMT